MTWGVAAVVAVVAVVAVGAGVVVRKKRQH